jgi:hypothetical protein
MPVGALLVPGRKKTRRARSGVSPNRQVECSTGLIFFDLPHAVNDVGCGILDDRKERFIGAGGLSNFLIDESPSVIRHL